MNRTNVYPYRNEILKVAAYVRRVRKQILAAECIIYVRL